MRMIVTELAPVCSPMRYWRVSSDHQQRISEALALKGHSLFTASHAGIDGNSGPMILQERCRSRGHGRITIHADRTAERPDLPLLDIVTTDHRTRARLLLAIPVIASGPRPTEVDLG
jgi:hypothetical protein